MENCKFICGKLTQKQWIETNNQFLNDVASKCGQSAKSSLLTGEVVVTDVDEHMIPKFDEKKYETAHLAKMK